MGVFDYITCEYGGVPDLQYQTKDTDAQYMSNYKIDKEGQLWHEYRENKLWRKLNFRGSIVFYTDYEDEWFEFYALFDKGKVISIERI